MKACILTSLSYRFIDAKWLFSIVAILTYALNLTSNLRKPLLWVHFNAGHLLDQVVVYVLVGYRVIKTLIHRRLLSEALLLWMAIWMEIRHRPLLDTTLATIISGPTAGHLHAVVERSIHHAHRLHLHLRWLLLSTGGSVREQGFVDLEQSPLVVHEQVKNVSLVLAREVTDLDTVLCKLSESK